MRSLNWLENGLAAVAAAMLLAACLSDSNGGMPPAGIDGGGTGGSGGLTGAGGSGGGAAGSGGNGGASATGAGGATGQGGGGPAQGGGAGNVSPGTGGAAPRVDAGAGGTPRVDAGGTTGTGGSTSLQDASTGPGPSGVFVAVGYGGRRVRSIDDGRTWTDDQQLVANGGDDNMLLRTITWGNGMFVALGYRSMTSPDGQTWVDHGVTSLNQWMGAVTYAKATFVAVGGFGLRATSTDGVAWTNHMLDQTASHEAQILVYGDVQGGRFVSTNDDGKLGYSADGKTWQFATGTLPAIKEVAYGNGVFVGTGDAAVVVSSDGATWTAGPKLAVTTQGFLFAQGHFTALGSGHVFTSPDGVAWTDHAVSGIAGGALAYGHGTFVVVAGKSRRRSSDGLAWDAAVTSGTNDLVWVGFGPTM
jgi:hypothetical protein